MGKFLIISMLLFLLLFGLMIPFDITKIELVQLGTLAFLAGLIGGLVGWRFKRKNYNPLLTILIAPIITIAVLCFFLFISVLLFDNSNRISNPLANAIGSTVFFSFGIGFFGTLPSMIGCFITFKVCKRANLGAQPDAQKARAG